MRFRSKNSPPSTEVRPIGARALKSSLDTLRPFLPGSRVADLFAGQGRFGLGALKEQAEVVYFVETDHRRANALRQIAQGFGRKEVAEMDAIHFLRASAEEGRIFDIVFVDPPFPMWSPEFAQRLFDLVQSVLHDRGILLVKHPARVVAFLPKCGYSLWKSSRFGESILIYYKHDKEGKGTIVPPR